LCTQELEATPIPEVAKTSFRLLTHHSGMGVASSSCLSMHKGGAVFLLPVLVLQFAVFLVPIGFNFLKFLTKVLLVV
jgi:hypothetical protein